MGQSAMIYVRTKSGNPPSGHSCFWEECFLPSDLIAELNAHWCEVGNAGRAAY